MTTEPRPLTGLQRKVLEYLMAGRPNKEIARLMGISDGTAKKHVAHLREHYSVTSRVEVVVAAISRGDLEPPVANGRSRR